MINVYLYLSVNIIVNTFCNRFIKDYFLWTLPLLYVLYLLTVHDFNDMLWHIEIPLIPRHQSHIRRKIRTKTLWCYTLYKFNLSPFMTLYINLKTHICKIVACHIWLFYLDQPSYVSNVDQIVRSDESKFWSNWLSIRGYFHHLLLDHRSLISMCV